MSKAIALCSCPRLGFMDFMAQSYSAFAANQIYYKNLYGVFWSQALSNGIQEALDDGFEYIIATDYDSIYSPETVDQLMVTLIDHPEVDALCAMQMGRFSGLLISTQDGKLNRLQLKTQPVVPVITGHFGLTVFRASAFKDLPKPWFWSKPDSDGEWKSKSDKQDDDIYFWVNFHKAGKKLFLAPRLVIGHLELLIKWPGEELEGIYCTTEHYYKNGVPSDTWK